MLEDLTMLATLPVDATAVKKAQDEADKAAAGETVPPPDESDLAAADADRVVRRAEDAPEQEKSGEEDR